FCFLTTDAAVAPAALRSALKRSVDDSFNRITVDSDQSTSDTVAILANGLAETAPLDAGSRGFRQFTRALGAVTTRLARMLVERGMLRDGAKHERIRETMTRPAYTITIDLGLGRGEAHVFTCDLSEEYVRINAKYTT